jgi:uncharacterized membrane protein YoaK (UPF0700 family)
MSLRSSLDRFAAHDARHGPLPPLLLLLTIVTGLVDAVSYLQLGHVFVANMTGNIVFLGFAVVDAEGFSVPASLAAIAAFLLGALLGGRLAGRLGRHRGRLLAATILIESLLVAAALWVSLSPVADASQRYGLIGALALAMGMQNAAARRLAVPDLTTTVLTLTLTGFAAESPLAGGTHPNTSRRLLATAAMFLGAAIGALLLLHLGTAAVLALALLLLATALAGSALYLCDNQAWAQG